MLVQEAGASLFTIAKDVKLQVEFNPATVAEYRLVGYETRALKREDFNNDAVDAGDVGSGHTVTAIYEITPVGVDARMIDESRYDEGRRRWPAGKRERIRLSEDPLQTTQGQRVAAHPAADQHRCPASCPRRFSAMWSSPPRWRVSRSCCAAANTPAR